MLKDRISEITQHWFLSEEALFSVFCTHRLALNSGMKCHTRVGKGVIEVNPTLCDDITDKELEERLRIELIRILLKHPYERQPEGCSLAARALGSNCVIGDSYKLQRVEMERPSDFNLPRNGHFEFYARYIEKILQRSRQGQEDDQDEQGMGGGGNGGDQNGQGMSGGGNGQGMGVGNGDEFADDEEDGMEKELEERGEIAANWEHDDLMAATVNEVIRNVKSWGTMAGKIVEQILASTKARLDYRKVLAGFRATVISQRRKLTRMRPNRRSGFEAMGSRYDFKTRLIIGVDCSGSITSEDLRNFYGTINRFFQYGMDKIDVVQFDTALGKVQTLEKASEKVDVVGRGGTCFQPFIDFVAGHPEYDGALIYTDGYAEQPTIPSTMRTPLCWVLRSEEELRDHEAWMRESGRVCVIENT